MTSYEKTARAIAALVWLEIVLKLGRIGLIVGLTYIAAKQTNLIN